MCHFCFLKSPLSVINASCIAENNICNYYTSNAKEFMEESAPFACTGPLSSKLWLQNLEIGICQNILFCGYCC